MTNYYEIQMHHPKQADKRIGLPACFLLYINYFKLSYDLT